MSLSPSPSSPLAPGDAGTSMRSRITPYLPTLLMLLAALTAGLLAIGLSKLCKLGTTPTVNPDRTLKILSTVLVYFMQLGFIAFEAGAVPELYRRQSVVKNLLVFAITFAAYLLVGRFIHQYFYPAVFSINPKLEMAFHAGFACTVALIIANALTERTTLPATLLFAVTCAGLGYPVLAGLAWNPEWNRFGFLDMAGAGVVHLYGGVVAFCAAFVVGPTAQKQRWQFLERPPIPNLRSPFTVIGGLFLWFGWLGFNSGNADSAFFMHAFLNTCIGACGGVIIAMCLGILATFFLRLRRAEILSFGPEWVLKEFSDHERLLIGMMGGLVSVTAIAAHPELSLPEAFAQAAFGGVIAVVGSVVVVGWATRLDDPLGAIATHAGAGLVGVLLAPVWVADDLQVNHFLVQFLGISICIFVASLLVVVPCAILLLIEERALSTTSEWQRAFFLQGRIRLSPVAQPTSGRLLSESPLIRRATALVNTLTPKDKYWLGAVQRYVVAGASTPPTALFAYLEVAAEAEKVQDTEERNRTVLIARVVLRQDRSALLVNCLERGREYLDNSSTNGKLTKDQVQNWEALFWAVAYLGEDLFLDPEKGGSGQYRESLAMLDSGRTKAAHGSVRDICRTGTLDLLSCPQNYGWRGLPETKGKDDLGRDVAYSPDARLITATTIQVESSRLAAFKSALRMRETGRLKEHAGSFVAICNEKVVASGKSFAEAQTNALMNSDLPKDQIGIVFVEHANHGK